MDRRSKHKVEKLAENPLPMLVTGDLTPFSGIPC